MRKDSTFSGVGVQKKSVTNHADEYNFLTHRSHALYVDKIWLISERLSALRRRTALEQRSW